MAALLVYDSVYGNTENIARAIARGFSHELKLTHVNQAKSEYLDNIDLLIIGSPTQGGKATQNMLDFVDNLVVPRLKSFKLAVFDTRLTSKKVGIFGFAAKKIAENLKNKGVDFIISPEGFYVKNAKGPLADGELEKAELWGKKLFEAYNQKKGLS
jgi:flavodoxin I